METVSTLHDFGFRVGSRRLLTRAIVAGRRECVRGGTGGQHPGTGDGRRCGASHRAQ